MYKSAREYLQIQRPIHNLKQFKQPVKKLPLNNDQHFQNDIVSPAVSEHHPPFKKPINISYNSQVVNNLENPSIWGPAFWFSLHNGARHYPENPNDRVKYLMKHRILAIPIELPCEKCRHHAQGYIESRKNELDKIVSSRGNLFNFYVDFHNQVNKRYNKPVVSYKKAWEIWSGDGDIQIKCNIIEYK